MPMSGKMSCVMESFKAKALNLIVLHHIAFDVEKTGVLSYIPRELLKEELLVSLMAVMCLA